MGMDQLTRRDSAFTEFYRRELATQVRRVAVLMRSDAVANDVVHDAMLEVYARWSSIRDPGAYLNRSVLNRCRDHARREPVVQRAHDKVARSAETVEHEPPLGGLFDRLPFNQRAALTLRYYEDMTIAEIAVALDCPQGSVGPWLDRALKSLREQLA